MKIKYIISSHKNYYDLTINKLLDSLKSVNIFDNDIFVAVGGEDSEYRYIQKGDILHFNTTANSFDLTALIEVVKHDLFTDYDALFLLHDTCEVGTKFKEKIESYKYDINGLNGYKLFGNYPSSNIGLYKRDFLMYNKEQILALENQTKTKYVELEDFIFDKLGTFVGFYDVSPKILGYKNIYSDNAVRQINYIENLDLIKYKANWEVKDWVLEA